MAEEWRIIAEFPDYGVSSEGRIKRVVADRYGRNLGRILKPIVGPHGYHVVSLHRDARQQVRLVHRVVCQTFHGDPPNVDSHASHHDGVRTNNAAVNLRWASPVENNRDKIRHGTVVRGDRHPSRLNPSYLPRGTGHLMSKLDDASVVAIRLDSRPQKAIAAAFGVSQSLISMVKSRKIWTHIGEPA